MSRVEMDLENRKNRFNNSLFLSWKRIRGSGGLGGSSLIKGERKILAGERQY